MVLVHNKVWCFTSFSDCLTYCKVFFSPCFKWNHVFTLTNDLVELFQYFCGRFGKYDEKLIFTLHYSNLTDRRQNMNGASLDAKKLLRSKLVTYGHIISLAVKYTICLYAVCSFFWIRKQYLFLYSEMPLWLFDIQEPDLTGKYNLSSV